jgi:hypothetical protein
MLLTVTIVVFEVVAVILEHVEALILDFPTATPVGDDRHHETLVEWIIGCPVSSLVKSYPLHLNKVS